MKSVAALQLHTVPIRLVVNTKVVPTCLPYTGQTPTEKRWPCCVQSFVAGSERYTL